jgi:ZIP family zinc transporter
MLLTLAFASGTFLSTMAGGLAASRWSSRPGLLFGFAGGVVLGAAVFDLLPEAIDHAAQSGVPGAVPYLSAACGYLALRGVERGLHHHDHTLGPDRIGVAGAAGFTVHSFFDGVAIGLGFQVSDSAGLIVALAVIGHDFADGLNTVSYLVAHGQGFRRQMRWLVADATAPLAGAFVAVTTPVPAQVFPVAVGFFAGVFVHAATSSLIPRAVRAVPALTLPLALSGAGLMFAVSRLA